ncbi:acyl-CoA thioesterase [Thiomicrorhabdus arctica]|jgi:acyl-CoA thioester hydrolase|uniref:acyl-CoA thioesterase n=1 Tax=Thiomicrorhabdus arctica TaxID=131540 RepID=UPI0003638783|nr:acyl-CoA thioesterase [Thiomicrorhabdus arctica]
MFKYEMRVRDYECDLQKVVNNSVYQNYLEHARHEFLLANGVDFAELAAKGINLMVIRVELDFKKPLTSQDDFYVTVEVQQESRIKFAFIQHIYHQKDNRLIVSGKAVGLAVNLQGRPMVCPDLERLMIIQAP